MATVTGQSAAQIDGVNVTGQMFVRSAATAGLMELNTTAGAPGAPLMQVNNNVNDGIMLVKFNS